MDDGTILVVDDDPVVVNLLTVSFEMEGYRVVSQDNGPAALDAARRHDPDVIVLDVMMPGMDGLEVARRLRADPATRGLPILLLSAKAQAPDVAKGLEIADDYVTKPFEPLHLLDRVAALRSRRARPAPEATGTARPAPEATGKARLAPEATGTARPAPEATGAVSPSA